MPQIIVDSATESEAPRVLPFPPVLKSHILHCSYNYWHPKYRTITPKARLIPLTKPFLEYLRADGIILPSDEENHSHEWSDKDSGIFSASDSTDAAEEQDEEEDDVAAGWRDIHDAIKDRIAELGGQVMPKLNWSAPKDATWMNANTMACNSPDDVYLLLKSSDFITHDLEHPFDDCVDAPGANITIDDIPYCLALRKYVPKFNPSVEFRCFVRERKLLCMCQRDLNHFDFLFNMQWRLRSLIKEFFEVRLRDSFPDENFVFDIYIPPPYDRVWLVDFNPWAPRTDPLLFSWMELLDMPDPPDSALSDSEGEEIVRLSLSDSSSNVKDSSTDVDVVDDSNDGPSASSEDEEADEEIWLPELRLVRKTDPEAYSFNTPQYSAHKLPKDVVDASQSGEGLREFAQNWQQILAQQQKEDEAAESSEGD